MLNQIHHINFLVRDLSRATTAFARLFRHPPVRESLPLRGADTVRFEVGNTWFVLVSPTCEDGVIGQLLAQRGEGVFLVSMGANNIQQTLNENPCLKMLGEPRDGLANWHVQDIDVEYNFNIIFQLCEEK